MLAKDRTKILSSGPLRYWGWGRFRTGVIQENYNTHCGKLYERSVGYFRKSPSLLSIPSI